MLRTILTLMLLLAATQAHAVHTWYAQNSGNWNTSGGSVSWKNESGTTFVPFNSADGDVWDSNGYTVTLTQNMFEGNWTNPSAIQDSGSTHGQFVMNGYAIDNGASGQFTVGPNVTISNVANSTFPTAVNWTIAGKVSLGSATSYAPLTLAGTTTITSGGVLNIVGNNNYGMKTTGICVVNVLSGGSIGVPATIGGNPNYAGVFQPSSSLSLSVASGGTLNCANGGLWQPQGGVPAATPSISVAPGATFILGTQNFTTTSPAASTVLSTSAGGSSWMTLGALSSGTLTPIGSLMLTTGTIGTVAGTWNASNLTLSKVASGTAFGVGLVGTLDVSHTGDTFPGVGYFASGSTLSYGGTVYSGSNTLPNLALTLGTASGGGAFGYMGSGSQGSLNPTPSGLMIGTVIGSVSGNNSFGNLSPANIASGGTATKAGLALTGTATLGGGATLITSNGTATGFAGTLNVTGNTGAGGVVTGGSLSYSVTGYAGNITTAGNLVYGTSATIGTTTYNGTSPVYPQSPKPKHVPDQPHPAAPSPSQPAVETDRKGVKR